MNIIKYVHLNVFDIRKQLFEHIGLEGLSTQPFFGWLNNI